MSHGYIEHKFTTHEAAVRKAHAIRKTYGFDPTIFKFTDKKSKIVYYVVVQSKKMVPLNTKKFGLFGA